jgi:hypothetical protein
MFKRNLKIFLHILSSHEDVLSIYPLLSFKIGPSYVYVIGDRILFTDGSLIEQDGVEAAYTIRASK